MRIFIGSSCFCFRLLEKNELLLKDKANKGDSKNAS